MFPYESSQGFNIMHSEKNHSIVHGEPDIARWAGVISMSSEAPETGHKFWIKEPGGCTNQGPKAALTMMNHMQRKQVNCYASLSKVFLVSYFKYFYVVLFNTDLP